MTRSALPLVRLVDYVFDADGAGDIVIATDDGELAAAAADNVVAFEIDDTDDAQGTNWSVVITGLAQKVTEVSAVSRARALGVAALSYADPLMFLRIPASVVVGATRRLAGAEPPCQPDPQLAALTAGDKRHKQRGAGEQAKRPVPADVGQASVSARD
ncbi:MAG TPA: pyridoxamine 5'-phosphate oxidase family protein [Isosphaeraceae bacterium]|nr:pyridoxamine 5'-phosphate oxidase family protein [Isosphaeraceae bacterium]